MVPFVNWSLAPHRNIGRRTPRNPEATLTRNSEFVFRRTIGPIAIGCATPSPMFFISVDSKWTSIAPEPYRAPIVRTGDELKFASEGGTYVAKKKAAAGLPFQIGPRFFHVSSRFACASTIW